MITAKPVVGHQKKDKKKHMATNINIFHSNFRLGTNVTLQRRLIDITVNWTNDAGQPQTRARAITFPDDLALIPTEVLKEELTDLMVRMARRIGGVDA